MYNVRMLFVYVVFLLYCFLGCIECYYFYYFYYFYFFFLLSLYFWIWTIGLIQINYWLIDWKPSSCYKPTIEKEKCQTQSSITNSKLLITTCHLHYWLFFPASTENDTRLLISNNWRAYFQNPKAVKCIVMENTTFQKYCVTDFSRFLFGNKASISWEQWTYEVVHVAPANSQSAIRSVTECPSCIFSSSEMDVISACTLSSSS